MKILMPLIKGSSGNDVYFESLNHALGVNGVSATIRSFPQQLEIFPALARLFLSWGDDLKTFALVHTNADYGDWFKMGSKPFIVTVHHNVLDEAYQKYTTATQRMYHHEFLKRRMHQALKSASKVIAVSYSTKISLQKTFLISDIEVIHNGVDIATFRPIKIHLPDQFTGRTKILFVGNLTKRKGAELLPQIMRQLGKDYILFYTSGLRTKRIFSEPNMVALGSLDRRKLVEMYNHCDVFLMPSRLEGFGYAVAEAMACGKPVVCTNGSSLPELVLDKKGGFLCAQDDVEDFVEKITILGNDRQLRETMGDFNRARILQGFTIQKMGEKYMRLYQDAVRPWYPSGKLVNDDRY